jgi:hypothetical protein
MYVCMYMFVFISLYVCIYMIVFISIYVYMYVCIYMFVFISIYVCMYVCIYVCIYIYICISIVCICIHNYYTPYLCGHDEVQAQVGGNGVLQNGVDGHAGLLCRRAHQPVGVGLMHIIA